MACLLSGVAPFNTVCTHHLSGVLLPLHPPSIHTFAFQDGLAEKLGSGEVPCKIREAPFVQIPLGVTEDRLVGTVDIEASMKVRNNYSTCGMLIRKQEWSYWVGQSAGRQ